MGVPCATRPTPALAPDRGPGTIARQHAPSRRHASKDCSRISPAARSVLASGSSGRSNHELPPVDILRRSTAFGRTLQNGDAICSWLTPDHPQTARKLRTELEA